MNLARKITLLAMSAGATMALAAANASAQESEVEVINEPNGASCGPCSIVLTTESHLVAIPPGVQISTCENTYTVELNHDGTGEVEWIGASHGAPGCNAVNCSVMSDHWVLHSLGELSGETEHLTLEHCLRSVGGSESECDVELLAQDLEGDPHQYSFYAAQLCANGSRRLEIAAVQTSGDQFEFTHHDN